MADTRVLLHPVRDLTRTLRNYANFTGRASRGEFWWFALVYLLLNTVTTVLDLTVGGYDVAVRLGCAPDMACFTRGSQHHPGFLFDLGLNVALGLPLLTVTVRRLRDAGYNPWLAALFFGLAIPGTLLGYVYLATDVVGLGIVSSALSTAALLGSAVLVFFLAAPSSPAKDGVKYLHQP